MFRKNPDAEMWQQSDQLNRYCIWGLSIIYRFKIREYISIFIPNLNIKVIPWMTCFTRCHIPTISQKTPQRYFYQNMGLPEKLTCRTAPRYLNSLNPAIGDCLKSVVSGVNAPTITLKSPLVGPCT
jgi:hypothetical protein